MSSLLFYSLAFDPTIRTRGRKQVQRVERLERDEKVDEKVDETFRHFPASFRVV